jgi:two-component system, OmpR family, sensor kinase
VAHTRPTDAIELRARAVGGNVSIEVVDEGCGVPTEALDHIFERFARVDASGSHAREGVGLGLAIVDAIARAHGGHCSVQSSSEGSTFTLVVPGFRHTAELDDPLSATLAAHDLTPQ